MTDIALLTVTGRLTRDSELKATAGGSPVLEFSLAYNTARRGGNGYEDKANFLDCTIFGNRAAALADILRKGMKVTVAGTLEQHSWEKDGQKRSKHSCYVRDIVLPARGEAQPRQQTQTQYAEPSFDEELPF